MTEDERRDRNPAPEVGSLKLAECPELRVDDLVLHRVYILHGSRMAGTFNYMGVQPTLDPVSLDTMMCHAFFGPRIGLKVALLARDGYLYAGDGQKITLRKYSGADT
jgi:hypothetical protein